MTSSDGPSDERLNRNWQELLQELRVAQTGVQILTGFLLTIPFTPRFESLRDESRAVYACVLGSAVVATFLLMTPVALHRALFRRGQRFWLVKQADTAARIGLAFLAIANIGALWLILDFISARWVAFAASGVLALGVLGLWVLLPELKRHSGS